MYDFSTKGCRASVIMIIDSYTAHIMYSLNEFIFLISILFGRFRCIAFYKISTNCHQVIVVFVKVDAGKSVLYKDVNDILPVFYAFFQSTWKNTYSICP